MASEAFNFIAVIICYKRDALMLNNKINGISVVVRQASYDRKNVGASLADARLTTAD